MQNIIASVNYLSALGGIVLFLVGIFLIYDLYTTKSLEYLVKKHGTIIALVVAVGASALTLVYSVLFGMAPCGLCWLQRVFLYPQAIILAVAIAFKQKTFALYGLALSLFGLPIALYQHYIQMGGTELVTCPTTQETVSCATRTLFEFNFITFPLLSAILFFFLGVLYWYIFVTSSETNNTQNIEE